IRDRTVTGVQTVLFRSRTRKRFDLHLQHSDPAMSLILIIEDNEKNLKLVRDVLQVKGYATIEAVNAEDGIELAKTCNPDLVLMEIGRASCREREEKSVD